jgi:hypothetical protein
MEKRDQIDAPMLLAEEKQKLLVNLFGVTTEKSYSVEDGENRWACVRTNLHLDKEL